jgi:hypothetical protein
MKSWSLTVAPESSMFAAAMVDHSPVRCCSIVVRADIGNLGVDGRQGRAVR